MDRNPHRKACPRTPAKRRTERERVEARLAKAKRRIKRGRTEEMVVAERLMVVLGGLRQ